jgi:hypothetical protein
MALLLPNAQLPTVHKPQAQETVAGDWRAAGSSCRREEVEGGDQREMYQMRRSEGEQEEWGGGSSREQGVEGEQQQGPFGFTPMRPHAAPCGPMRPK